MVNKNLREQMAELLKGLTEEQKEKAKACKTPEELMAFLGKLGAALPDELLDAVAGGVTQDEFICAWLAREWELEQEWRIDMWDFAGQQRAQDQAWEDVVNTLGAPD